jgi:uncharacterized membrane protein YgaE (UPF0421/DUF939 family)
MTAAIVIRRGLPQEFQRGLARFAGTMAGALIASLLLLALPENQWFRAAGVALFAWAAVLGELRLLCCLPHRVCRFAALGRGAE